MLQNIVINSIEMDCSRLVSFVFLATHQIIANAWKKWTLNFAKVKKRVMGTMVIEKTTATLNDTCKIFKKIWMPWIIVLINARQT